MLGSRTLTVERYRFLANVTYSAAYDSKGDRIEATGDYQGIKPYYCPGCGEQMIAKNAERSNRKRAKHFAHQSKDASCSNESILHRDAKRLIARSIRVKPSYWITVKCGSMEYTNSQCENVLLRMDLAGADADIEKYIKGNRADVLVRTQEGIEIVIAIEVVVHHETTVESRLRYESSNIPVLFVHVKSEEDIRPLHERIMIYTDDYIGQLPRCNVCEERAKAAADRQRAREESERQQAIAKAAAERQRAREESERRRARAETAAERQRVREEAERQRTKAEAERRRAEEEAAHENRRARQAALADESNIQLQERTARLVRAYRELEKYQIAMNNANMVQYNISKQLCISSAGAQMCDATEQKCPLLLCNSVTS